jgi:diaminopimelate decarboxylase
MSLRVNPHVDARTHPYIATALRESKFGVPIARARAVYRRAAQLPGIRVKGLDFHLGSQMTSLGPFREALAEIGALWDSLRRDGHALEHLDVGGGLGIRYEKRSPPSAAQWLRALRQAVHGRKLELLVEPGRAIAGDAGALLTRVIGRKQGHARRFLMVDAAMNDLLRPALYGAHHAIVPVRPRRGRALTLDVVGPVCESADFLARQRKMVPPEQGDLLAVLDAGAYGFSMGSSYNSRRRPAEVLVEGSNFRVIREREKLEELWRGEG